MAIVDEGRIVAMGTPREIQERTLAASSHRDGMRAAGSTATPCRHWRDAERVALDERRTVISVTSHKPARTVVEMVKWLDENGLELVDIRIQRPSLEDAFIELTGKSLRE